MTQDGEKYAITLLKEMFEEIDPSDHEDRKKAAAGMFYAIKTLIQKDATFSGLFMKYFGVRPVD